MDSLFSSSERTVLERCVEVNNEIQIANVADIWNLEQSKRCIDWIKINDYKKICLQFPDNYLVHSGSIFTDLCNALSNDQNDRNNRKLFILADTSYANCCVDEIAASHVEADCIIHFGYACRSETIRLPVLYCFPQLPIDIKEFCQQLALAKDILQNKTITIYLDIGYHDALKIIKNNPIYLDNLKQIEAKHIYIVEYCGDSYGTLSSNGEFHFCPDRANYQKQINVESDNTFIYVGNDNKRFFQVSLNHKTAKWFVYDLQCPHLKEENPLISKYIQRRYYYIEKCKDAKILGLIVATLTANGYLEVIKHLQTMAKQRGIRTQIISVGRINPAKLANFLEIDCFVLIGCPFNSTYDSKEFFKPIVTVFEAEIALNPAWHQQYPEIYVTDFKQLLPGGKYFIEFDGTKHIDTDVSLVNGRMRNWSIIDNNYRQTFNKNEKTLCTQNDSVTCLTGNLQLQDRTWRGLDPDLNNSEPAQLQKGLSGIPIQYTHN